jgi:hypothetical protein
LTKTILKKNKKRRRQFWEKNKNKNKKIKKKMWGKLKLNSQPAQY